MTFVGHSQTLARLPDPMPQCLLLTGPEGIGKSLVALDLARKTGVRGLDYQAFDRLDKSAARDMITHHSTHPLVSPVKVTVADLSQSSEEAQNSVLKLLEEPAPYSYFILLSDREPILTIRSRCFHLRFGSLSHEEVRTVLSKMTLPEAAIDTAVAASQGRVSVALSHVAHHPSKKHVEGILRAVHDQKEQMIEGALTEALEPSPNEPRGLVDQRREAVASLFARSLRSSLTQEDHALRVLPLPNRVEAIRLLESAGRPALRVRAAAWMLLV